MSNVDFIRRDAHRKMRKFRSRPDALFRCIIRLRNKYAGDMQRWLEFWNSDQMARDAEGIITEFMANGFVNCRNRSRFTRGVQK